MISTLLRLIRLLPYLCGHRRLTLENVALHYIRPGVVYEDISWYRQRLFQGRRNLHISLPQAQYLSDIPASLPTRDSPDQLKFARCR